MKLPSTIDTLFQTEDEKEAYEKFAILRAVIICGFLTMLFLFQFDFESVA